MPERNRNRGALGMPHTLLKQIDLELADDPRNRELRKLAISVAAMLPDNPDEAMITLRYAARIIADFYR
jgi:hypothetical protein